MKYIILMLLHLSLLIGSDNIVLFGNAYKPPKVWTEDGVTKGILVEVVKEVQKELDVKFDIQTYPWARSYKMALNGKGGIMGISYTKERAEVFDFNKVPLFLDTIIIVTKKNKEFPFEKIEDLQGKRIGYCRGCSFGKTFEEAKKYFIPVETDDSREQRLMLLLKGKIDAALLGPGSFALQTICAESALINYDDFTILKKPLVVDPNYMAFLKELNKQKLLEEFDIILQKKIDEKTIQNILDSFFKEQL